MALREYTDGDGVAWRVWDVQPRYGGGPTGAPGRAGFTPGLEQGWVCFECATEKRRLTPIPPDWDACSEARLDAYRRYATPVRSDGTSAPPAASG